MACGGTGWTSCSGTCSTGCKDSCVNGCSGGCQNGCKGTCTNGCSGSCGTGCSTNCHVGCDNGCGSTCVLVCNNSCSGGCSGSCGGGCSSCGGCDYGCSSCTGGCTGSCGGECKENCLGACKNNCDKQCQSSNYSDINNINIKHNEWLKAEDINIIINTIKYEVARRKLTNTNYSVMIGERIDDNKINEIIKNLKLLGYNYKNINYGEKSNRSLIQKIIEDTKTSYNKVVDSYTGKES